MVMVEGLFDDRSEDVFILGHAQIGNSYCYYLAVLTCVWPIVLFNNVRGIGMWSEVRQAQQTS